MTCPLPRTGNPVEKRHYLVPGREAEAPDIQASDEFFTPCVQMLHVCLKATGRRETASPTRMDG
jgi:hypothetical protein